MIVPQEEIGRSEYVPQVYDKFSFSKKKLSSSLEMDMSFFICS